MMEAGMNKSILWLVIFSSPGHSAVVVDAFNTCVGEYLGQANGQFEVGVTSLGYRFGFDRVSAMYVDEASVVGRPDATAYRVVYFPTSDCTGMALTNKDIPPGSVFPIADGVLYYAPQLGRTNILDIGSKYENGVCRTALIPYYYGYEAYPNNQSITGVRPSLTPPLQILANCINDG
jgi:hypothetical protein